MATRKRKRPAKKKPTKAQIQARNQFVAICLLLLGVFLFLLAVIEGSAGWQKMHGVLYGLFGWSSFFIGPLFIYVAIMTSFEKISGGIRLRAVLTVLFLCVMSAAWQIFLAGEPVDHTLGTLWSDGKSLHGGGVLSVLFGLPLMKLGTPGDKIVVVLLLVFLLMVITGTTIAGVLRTAKKPVTKIVEAGHEISDSIAERQETRAAARRAQVDIPLGDEAPVRRRKKAETTPKQKLLTVAASEQSTPPAVIPEAEATVEEVQSPIIEAPAPDEPIDDAHQIRIDDIIDRIAQKERAAAAAAAPEVPAEKPAETAPDTDAAAEPLPKPDYVMPPLTLLQEPRRNAGDTLAQDELRQNAQLLVDTLQSFGVQTRIVDIARGPAVTRYELQPSAGVKISRITNLADDIALNLAAAGVRIEAPIPGKAAVGIEVPNKSVTSVTLREVIASPTFENAKSRLAVALGRNVSGAAIVADIAKMPHLLIAGATGSGKSVCINSIIMSLLYRAKPDEVKLLLVDPKVVELGVYNGLPHLAVPVVTDPKKAAGALAWAVTEMLNRYKLFASVGARDLTSYNKLVASQEDGPAPMPQYVIIVDELADLMMAAPSEVEDSICRLAQMARAAGMHLIIATQRPSVDVITCVIKANIPSRIAFAVSSQVDSRTILDAGGAEKLLGMGDMLFSPVGSAKPMRVQGCFVSDEEIERVVTFIKSAENGDAVYDEALIAEIDRHVPAGKGNAGGSGDGPSAADDEDPMLMDAIECVVEAGQASTSLLQRRCKLGYARAARLIDELEARGIIGPFEGAKPRAVLISKERWLEMKLNRSDSAPAQQQKPAGKEPCL